MLRYHWAHAPCMRHVLRCVANTSGALAPDVMHGEHLTFHCARPSSHSCKLQGGDPVAQMSLGYRHMQGLGVPKSCQTGAPVHAPAGVAAALRHCSEVACSQGWLLGLMHCARPFIARALGSHPPDSTAIRPPCHAPPACSGAVLRSSGGASAGNGADAGRPAAGVLHAVAQLPAGWAQRLKQPLVECGELTCSWKGAVGAHS